jgi:hypothetical protein
MPFFSFFLSHAQIICCLSNPLQKKFKKEEEMEKAFLLNDGFFYTSSINLKHQ